MRSYRCGFGDEPLNASSWCTSCRSRRRCRCATPCASSARCVALAWVWTPLDPAGRTEESEEPFACWVACPWHPQTCQTGAAPCRGSAFERKPEASDGKPAETRSGAGGSHPDSTEASYSPWPAEKQPVWVARKTSCMKRCPLVWFFGSSAAPCPSPARNHPLMARLWYHKVLSGERVDDESSLNGAVVGVVHVGSQKLGHQAVGVWWRRCGALLWRHIRSCRVHAAWLRVWDELGSHL